MLVLRSPFVNKLRRCHVPCVDARDRGWASFGEYFNQQAVFAHGEYLLCDALAVVGKDLQHWLVQENAEA